MVGILDPDRPIVDPHHHLWSGDERGTYLQAEVFAEWKASMAAAAACPNMAAKLGGMVMFDNGFGWDERAEPVTAEEFAAAQRDYYLHASTSSAPTAACSRATSRWRRRRFPYRVVSDAFKLMTADFSEADKDALFSGTARRVYRLPPVKP